MDAIRTAGDLRTFLAEIMVGIRDKKVDTSQAHAISKVAAQINNSLAVEVNTALQLERMGRDRPVAGTMLIGSGDELPQGPRPLELEERTVDTAAEWAAATIKEARWLSSMDKLNDFVFAICANLERLMAARPELHAEVSAAIEEQRSALTPSAPANSDDEMVWCDECDMDVAVTEAAGCKSPKCSFKAVA